ncbi:MAG: hypothetical protein LBB75_06840 [Oscillospiraceae bacterium]|jgi:hypothetical protein|nr:hypothetical protein [Oscillospiraceae bacterium]
MYPFLYYVDCEGNLWVPCSCGCGGGNNGSGNNGSGSNGSGITGSGNNGSGSNGATGFAYANGGRGYREAMMEQRDSCARRDYECIRPASESERAMLRREQEFEKMLTEALEAIKRLESLHEQDVGA